MREFGLIASVIVPIFLMMCLGYFIMRRKVIDRKGADQLNNIVFKFLLPVQLFMNIFTSDLAQAMNWKLIGYSLGMVLLSYLALNLFVPRLFLDKRQNVPMVHAMFRSNYVIFGLVVVGGFYPSEVAVASVLAAFVIPVYNVLAVILLEKGSSLKKTAMGCIKNPLIIASVLGVVCNLIKMPVHPILLKFLQDVVKMTNPVALLAVGMRFEFSSVKSNLRPLGTALAYRLLLLPVIATVGGILLGFTNVELMTILILFGSPCATACYTMSMGYDVDHTLANQLVVFTTICCQISLFILLMIFSHTPFMVF